MFLWFAKWLPFFFYVLFFFVPLALFPRTSELFEFNKMILTYGLTALIISSWLTKMVLKRKIVFRRTMLDIPLLIFLGSQILSTITSIDFRTSIFGYYSRFHGGLLSSISYSILYWAYVSNMDRKKTKKAIFFLLTSAVLVSIYGVLEHFGIDKDIWVQDVQNRVFSTLGQPNWLAGWLVALIPLTWAFAISNFQFPILKQIKRFKIQNYWIWIGVSTLFFLTLLYTKSRSGLLGFAAAYLIFWGLVYWPLLKRRDSLKTTLSKKFLILNSLFIILVLAIGTPWTPNLSKILKRSQITPQQVAPAAPALEIGGTESGEIRKIVWTGAINIWKNYPILGSGIETFAYSYYNFRPVEHNLVSEWDFLYNKAHNEYLNLAATTGTIGLLSYGFLAISIVCLLVRKNGYLPLAFLSGFVSILVTNFFGFSVVPVALQFFLFPAMAISLKKKSKRMGKQEIAKISKSQTSATIILCFLTLLALYSLAKYWSADIFYTRGKLENDRGDYKTGREKLEKAIKLSPKEAIYWDEKSQSSTGLALALFETDDNELANDFMLAAIAESDKAIALSPRNINLRRSRGNLFIKLSTFDSVYLFSAREVITDAIELAPTDAKLYYNLGLTHARIGELDAAIETLQKTIELKPNYRNARLALGLLYADQGETKKAKAELEYILEKIDPEDELVRQQLEEL